MGKLGATVAVAFLAVAAVYLLPAEQHAQLEQKVQPLMTWYKDQVEVARTKFVELSNKISQSMPSASETVVPPANEISEKHSTIISATPFTEEEVAACRLSGKVAGCGCDFASVERLVDRHLHPLLSDLVQQPYFRYFKVNLYCDCQFWPDEGQCFQKDCCVAECKPDEIPAAWRAEDEAVKNGRNGNGGSGQVAQCEASSVASCEGVAGVDRSVEARVENALSAIESWPGLNNPWVPSDAQDDVEYIYVDLQRNPEKYTGYKGQDARRLWAAIYAQSALAEVAAHQQAQQVQAEGGAPAHPVEHEKEVLYRLISGMHSSITTSIVTNYYNESSGTWGPNLPFFKARFASPESRPFVENLYFALLFVLRAVTKANGALTSLDFNTGSPEADVRTRALVGRLVADPDLAAACPAPFDEGLLWRHDSADRHAALREQLQEAFHNITRLMDCVGCEKCKMHGKLNILGIAAAMKVLFAQPDEALPHQPHLHLHRNEAIALINLLAKLADSVHAVRELNLQLQHAEAQAAQAAGTAAAR